MKKFVFTLHSLLHLKQSLEKQERNTLAELTGRLNLLQAQREEMIARRDEATELISRRLSQGMRAYETEQFTAFDRHIRAQIEEQRNRILQVQTEQEACRARLVEAMREVHMLEKLREKQYEQYKLELEAEQNNIINDFVSYQNASAKSMQ